jgi:hypothetical protein
VPFDEKLRGLKNLGKTTKRMYSGISDTRKALDNALPRKKKSDQRALNPIAKVAKALGRY